MTMIKKTIQRGFVIYEFADMYAELCSIQESSLATRGTIWMGVNANRMHLTQDQVKELLPILQHFAETGELL